ncbi:MBL fold metallo-hydrolase [Actinomadura gamaensis]|uniref:MBL fold metallo-hydrolase n=1 Tax=Actinomadura gamaensis TaxID=1763541 RepID=A0ABV9U8P9_9ACTN
MTGDALTLTVLGSATPYPEPENPCSGYLLTAGDTRVWVDAGTGTLAELRRHVQLDGLDAIWISHLHADHTADLLTAYYGALYADVRLSAPIPLFGPPGTADRLAHFLTNSARRSPVESAFAVEELHDGHSVRVGGLTLTSREVAHGLPAFALRAEAAGGALAYSGDTGPCAALTELADGSDLLVCEADSAEPLPADERVHCTPEDAGDTARAANVRRLLVTHVGPFLTPAEATARTASRYDGPVDHAAPRSVHAIRTPAGRPQS